MKPGSAYEVSANSANHQREGPCSSFIALTFISIARCADLDLYDGAPLDEMRQATRRAFAHVVDLAIDRLVDFVLIAGDIFDGDWPNFNTGLHFASELRRLAQADIRGFLINRNLDTLSKALAST